MTIEVVLVKLNIWDSPPPFPNFELCSPCPCIEFSLVFHFVFDQWQCFVVDNFQLEGIFLADPTISLISPMIHWFHPIPLYMLLGICRHNVVKFGFRRCSEFSEMYCISNFLCSRGKVVKMLLDFHQFWLCFKVIFSLFSVSICRKVLRLLIEDNLRE